MKIELKQSAVLGGHEYKCNHHGKAVIVDVPDSVKEEAHFKALLKDKMVKVLGASPEKVIAGEDSEADDETPDGGVKLDEKEKALVMAKAELAQLIAKEKPSKKDKERKAELEKVIAGE